MKFFGFKCRRYTRFLFNLTLKSEMPKRELSGSPSVEDAAFDLPPSVDLTKPLTSSYSYHSVIPQTLFDDEVILGVDEAGRGPVLGILVFFRFPINFN